MMPAEAELFASWEKEERPYPWTAAQFLETLLSATQTTLVRELEGRPVGFGVVQTIQAEAYILNLMVQAQRRRHGVGEDLLRRLLGWAKDGGASHMLLDVDPANVAAYELYSKFGFRMIGRRPHGYPRGEPSVLMQKNL